LAVFLDKVQRLLLRHNLDLADLAFRDAREGKSRRRGTRERRKKKQQT
jgi:hypothetical protein